MRRKFENYLKTHRRQAGFSQDEIAFLLGTRCGTKVSRYEKLGRLPLLETAFAYEVIFQIPVRDIFAGLFEQAERETVNRVRRLASRLQGENADPASFRKLSALNSILVSVGESEIRNA